MKQSMYLFLWSSSQIFLYWWQSNLGLVLGFHQHKYTTCPNCLWRLMTSISKVWVFYSLNLVKTFTIWHHLLWTCLGSLSQVINRPKFSTENPLWTVSVRAYIIQVLHFITNPSFNYDISLEFLQTQVLYSQLTICFLWFWTVIKVIFSQHENNLWRQLTTVLFG